MRNTVIFDLDGTLLDTLEDLYLSANAAFESFGLPPKSREEIRRSVGNGVEVLMRRIVPEGEDNPYFEGCMRAYREHYQAHLNDHTRPYQGIPGLLEELKRRGWRLAIVSNKPDAAVKELNRQRFQEWILLAIGESPKVKRKPAPDMVLAAMEELGASREECVYVGDSEVDFKTAENCGLPCILVSWGFRERAALEGLGAGKIVDSPEELLLCLERLSNSGK